MSAPTTFAPGTRVQLTGAFLRNTGQLAGGEGRHVWTVEACPCGLCARGGFVAVNQDAVSADGRRHILSANLRAKGGPVGDHSADALRGVWLRPR